MADTENNAENADKPDDGYIKYPGEGFLTGQILARMYGNSFKLDGVPLGDMVGITAEGGTNAHSQYFGKPIIRYNRKGDIELARDHPRLEENFAKARAFAQQMQIEHNPDLMGEATFTEQEIAVAEQHMRRLFPGDAASPRWLSGIYISGQAYSDEGANLGVDTIGIDASASPRILYKSNNSFSVETKISTLAIHYNPQLQGEIEKTKEIAAHFAGDYGTIKNGLDNGSFSKHYMKPDSLRFSDIDRLKDCELPEKFEKIGSKYDSGPAIFYERETGKIVFFADNRSDMVYHDREKFTSDLLEGLPDALKKKLDDAAARYDGFTRYPGEGVAVAEVLAEMYDSRERPSRWHPHIQIEVWNRGTSSREVIARCNVAGDIELAGNHPELIADLKRARSLVKQMEMKQGLSLTQAFTSSEQRAMADAYIYREKFSGQRWFENIGNNAQNIGVDNADKPIYISEMGPLYMSETGPDQSSISAQYVSELQDAVTNGVAFANKYISDRKAIRAAMADSGRAASAPYMELASPVTEDEFLQLYYRESSALYKKTNDNNESILYHVKTGEIAFFANSTSNRIYFDREKLSALNVEVLPEELKAKLGLKAATETKPPVPNAAASTAKPVRKKLAAVVLATADTARAAVPVASKSAPPPSYNTTAELTSVEFGRLQRIIKGTRDPEHPHVRYEIKKEKGENYSIRRKTGKFAKAAIIGKAQGINPVVLRYDRFCEGGDVFDDVVTHIKPPVIKPPVVSVAPVIRTASPPPPESDVTPPATEERKGNVIATLITSLIGGGLGLGAYAWSDNAGKKNEKYSALTTPNKNAKIMFAKVASVTGVALSIAGLGWAAYTMIRGKGAGPSLPGGA